ncbi:unnamed protein product [Cuscuta epithymum]|uniref:DUF4283 domain-containing protein n=1 Tax=Cuscuta epithymum TaxID=186058 RepID=A0AAV0FHS8_9ASTE|nr:unnamed protein product [Cuscuta epithymum]
MIWVKGGILQISNLSTCGYYLVRFTTKGDYVNAISGGPWMIGEHYITLHQWRKGLNLRNNKILTTVAWVRFPGFPIEFFHPEAIERITNKIGKPVPVDQATKIGARGTYARIRVIRV